MKYYFDQIRENIDNEITQAHDRTLNQEGYGEKLFEKHSIDFPELKKNQQSSKIDSKKLSMREAPSGFSFTPGKEYEFVTFQVPISGDLNFFNEALKTYRFDNFFYVKNRYVICIIFSGTSISGNDSEIERINNEARKKFESIESTLENHRSDVEDFNQNLKQSIEEKIDNEKSQREMKSSSEDKLNPFN